MLNLRRATKLERRRKGVGRIAILLSPIEETIVVDQTPVEVEVGPGPEAVEVVGPGDALVAACVEGALREVGLLLGSEYWALDDGWCVF